MSAARVSIHESQFPGRVQRQLLEALRRGEIPQKFHYESRRQAQKWLALHDALCPGRADPSFAAAYGAAFQQAQIHSTLSGAGPEAEACVIGLGCGGGEKDARLLAVLNGRGRKLSYTPVDVSVPLVLAAREQALAIVPAGRCSPVVCDLAAVSDWEELVPPGDSAVPRVITFFGMMPTLQPEQVLPQLSRLVRASDLLMVSANLVPAGDGAYAEGVARVLPQYDNAPTRDWLMTFLFEAGFGEKDGRLVFGIEEYPAGSGLLRVQATFHLERALRIRLEHESLDYAPGDRIRLFFSYRHTARLVAELLGTYGLQVEEHWESRTGEEGVFLVRRSSELKAC